MSGNINFPHLGIYLKDVGQSISIFGFEIAFYGMIIGLAVIAGILLAAHEAKRTKQNTDVYYDLAIYAVIFSVIGARLYYVIFSWDSYKDDLLSIFNIRQGGLAIYGAVIAAVLTVFVYSRIKKLSFWQLVDTAGLGLVLGQIIGRWGNFFNREAFGIYTDGLFAMQLPLDAVRTSDVTDRMMENTVVVDGITYIQAHPTFLYESLWNLGVLLILLWWRKHKKFEGEVFLLYVFGYGIGRYWIEGLRTDQLKVGHTSLAVSQLLAAVLVVVSAALIVFLRWRATKVPPVVETVEEVETSEELQESEDESEEDEPEETEE